MNFLVAFAAAVLTVAAVAAALAADIEVVYRVDAKLLTKDAPAGTSLTFQLFAEGSCADPVAAQAVDVENTTLIEQPKLLKVKNGPKPPSVAEIRYTLTGITPQAQTYATVTGAGITPIGRACQLQSASVGAVDPALPPPPTCPGDSVQVGGPTGPCVDKYEASLWQIPSSATTVIQHVQDGTATLAELTGAGATQLSLAANVGPPTYKCAPAIPGSFIGDGTNAASVYAVSIAGIIPAACIDANQAADACQFSGKRLLTNAEWTAAATGTPDPDTDDGTTDCNTGPPGTPTNNPANTGSRASCASPAGAFDMIGNVSEWTVGPVGCCSLPLSWIRGGSWVSGPEASVPNPYRYFQGLTLPVIGFRCAR